jgi:spermidine synthase
LMGFGFPIILSVCKKLSSSLELLYATNTLGAGLGALLPLFLLPIFGWETALIIVAGISVVVAAIAGILSISYRDEEGSGNQEPAFKPQQAAKKQLPILISYAGIGACALILEIAWTRLFGMLFLRTEYVLAIILAVFLFGTALGSFVSKYMAKDTWFNILPGAAAMCVIIGLWLLPSITSMLNTMEITNFSLVLLSQASVVVLLTFPVTVIFGAWLPLLNRRLGYLGEGGAQLYGVNSLGAALGTLLAGFVLIPIVGTYAAIVLGAVLIIIFSMAWVKPKKNIITVVIVAVVSIPVLKMAPVNELLPQSYKNTNDLYFYEDAVNITHVIEKADGQRILLADLQRMDASSDPVSVQSQRNQVRLPLLLHPNPKTALFLGLGTGISISASLAYPNLTRKAVEISQGAIEAAQHWFSAVNNDVISSTEVVRDDARRFLKADSENYDVIVGDLFHPDLVGRSALLSRQQFMRAKDRLTTQGIFVQWIALNQFDKESLNIVLRTFKQVFPEAIMFVDAFRLALVGITGPLDGLSILQNGLSQLDADGRNLAMGGETIHTWLGRYWGKINIDSNIEPNIDSNGPIQDEWNPVIEFRLPQARYNGDMDLVKLLHELVQHRPHVSQAAKELGIDSANAAAFERAYIGTELAHRSWLALLQKKNNEGHRLLKLAYQANPRDRWISTAVADATLENYDAAPPKNVSEVDVLESILRIRPDHPNALKRLWVINKNSGNTEEAQKYKIRFAKVSPLNKALKSQ